MDNLNPITQLITLIQQTPGALSHTSSNMKVPERFLDLSLIKYIPAPIRKDSKRPVFCCHANQKGGVGKTTTTFNHILSLADEGYKVLIVEFDMQCNITQQFISRELYKAIEQTNPTIFTSEQLFFPQISAESIHVFQSDLSSRVHCIAGNHMKLADLNSSEHADVSTMNRVEKVLAALDYDFVFFDTPPALSVPQLAALFASDNVFVPVEVDEHSKGGLEKLLIAITKMKKLRQAKFGPSNLPLKVTVYFNKYEKPAERKVASFKQREEEDIRLKFNNYILPRVLQRSTAMAEASSYRKPIWGHTINGGARVAATSAGEVFSAMNELVLANWTRLMGVKA